MRPLEWKLRSQGVSCSQPTTKCSSVSTTASSSRLRSSSITWAAKYQDQAPKLVRHDARNDVWIFGRRLGGAGADGVDAYAPLEQREGLAGDVSAHGLLHRDVIDFAVLCDGRHGGVEVGMDNRSMIASSSWPRPVKISSACSSNSTARAWHRRLLVLMHLVAQRILGLPG